MFLSALSSLCRAYSTELRYVQQAYAYERSHAKQRWTTDILLWGVIGFRVDLDKVIFFHDTLPCQSLVVFVFETLNNETKKKENIQTVSFAPYLLNQHLLVIWWDPGARRIRFILHRLMWVMLLTRTAAKRWNANEFLGNSEELGPSEWNRNAIFILNRDPFKACLCALWLSKIISLMNSGLTFYMCSSLILMT